ncbi:MAG: ATP-binding cassette domain-containing protein [Candidatus Sulfotelmatobacter sp.]
MSEAIAVEFKNVSKSFGDRKVLQDVSFQIEDGKALCILGRSGTGKSVTLKLMIRLLKPDSGSVSIETEDIEGLAEKELSRVRRKIGFLFQSAALFDSFTVADNLAVPLRHFEKTMPAAEVQHTVQELLGQVGLENDKGKFPGELSGGMKKRVGLARALILKPTLLLVDEPSSGLDPITAAEIDALLLKVKQERHTTLVIVTHDVREARKIADTLAVLDQGCLVGFGTLEELKSSENEVVRQLIWEC